ncbi:MAG: hypothetical protein HWE08_01785 [Alphaproteobacteria bacterium]|nr:hypothetical protein [Alphaproteobacteria bacterium]
MSLNAKQQAALAKIKKAFSTIVTPRQLEELSAALLAQLLEVPIAVARSGFQHGADAGTSGRKGRRLRIETKRYGDTKLNERELLGEIDQALRLDPAMEAWILVATQEVPEQIELALLNKAEQEGLPIVILDWKSYPLPYIVSLCISYPKITSEIIGNDLDKPFKSLKNFEKLGLANLKAELSEWALGYQAIREKSHNFLEQIWTDRSYSQSQFGQNVAGATQPDLIERKPISDKLSNWWNIPSQTAGPASLIGLEGTGKTWAAMQWMYSKKADMPITLLVPSGAAEFGGFPRYLDILEFISRQIQEITRVQSELFWRSRLDRLLKRPNDEGPTILILLDGLNQDPSTNWRQLLQVLETEPFWGRVRTIISSRPHYFENRLNCLKTLVRPPQRIDIGDFDLSEGGEIDQLLGFHGVNRKDLGTDLLKLACNPRIFRLVISLKSKLQKTEQITFHRILWEYGKSACRQESGDNFSEQEWREWLNTAAKQFYTGDTDASESSIANAISSPLLSPSKTYSRLSAIVDSNFVSIENLGERKFEPSIVVHALALALLNTLTKQSDEPREGLAATLEQWLDPIAGLDERSEIMRAAVSIALANKQNIADDILSLLVLCWLQTQNIEEAHRREITALGQEIPTALLEAIYALTETPFRTAETLAINSIIAIPPDDTEAAIILNKFCCTWISKINSEPYGVSAQSKDIAERFNHKLEKRLGQSVPCTAEILGNLFEVSAVINTKVSRAIPSLVQSFPLHHFVDFFELASIVHALTGNLDIWSDLIWVKYLNNIDPGEFAAAIRIRAQEVGERKIEEQLEPKLQPQARSSLLWLAGYSEDCFAATEITPNLSGISYEKDYLPNPGESLFALERRHAQEVLLDQNIPLWRRIHKTIKFVTEPTFNWPDTFKAELLEFLEGYNAPYPDANRHHTRESIDFEKIKLLLARLLPLELAQHLRRGIISFVIDDGTLPQLLANSILEALLIVDSETFPSITQLKDQVLDTSADGDSREATRQLFDAFRYLDLCGTEQAEEILESNPPFILQELGHFLKPLDPGAQNALIARFGGDRGSQAHNLCHLLWLQSDQLTKETLEWALDLANDENFVGQTSVYELLHALAPTALGEQLLSTEWSWQNAKDRSRSHIGSLCLIEASSKMSFEEIAPKIAPWLILRAVSVRGNQTFETRLAAEIIDALLMKFAVPPADPRAQLSVSLETRETYPASYEITPDLGALDEDDPYYEMKLLADQERYQEARTSVLRQVKAAVAKAQKTEVPLFLADLAATDFQPVIEAAPDLVKRWLSGMSEESNEWRSRLNRSEGAFLGLCEALLSADPKAGENLWMSLLANQFVQFNGRARINELVHIAFRVACKELRTKLIKHLYDISCTNTDEELFELSLAAALNNQQDWFDDFASKDSESTTHWRRLRSTLIRGYRVNNGEPDRQKLSEGRPISSDEIMQHLARENQLTEFSAKHWWNAFVSATTGEEAYAAWVLFSKCADRRAHCWVYPFAEIDEKADELSRKKLIHYRIHKGALKSAFKQNEKDFERKFLNKNISTSVYPWRTEH